jgi:CspA family cold shock protein
MRTGTVKFFNQKNKFGFIIDDETKKEYYVHAKELTEEIKEGDRVEFELKPAKRGDECTRVKKITTGTN